MSIYPNASSNDPNIQVLKIWCDLQWGVIIEGGGEAMRAMSSGALAAFQNSAGSIGNQVCRYAKEHVQPPPRTLRLSQVCVLHLCSLPKTFRSIIYQTDQARCVICSAPSVTRAPALAGLHQSSPDAQGRNDARVKLGSPPLSSTCLIPVPCDMRP